MATDLVSKVNALRSSACVDLVDSLLNGKSTEEIQSMHGRLTVIDALSSRLQPPKKSKFWLAACIAAASALTPIALAVIPVSQVPFVLEARSTTVSMGLTENIDIAQMRLTGSVNLEGINHAEGARVHATASNSDALRYGRFEARSTTLRAFRASAGSILSISTQHGAARVAVRSSSGPISGDLDLTLPTWIEVGGHSVGTQESDASPVSEQESVHFKRTLKGSGREAAVVSVTAESFDALKMMNEAWPASIRFIESRPSTNGVAQFASSLSTGSLVLPSTGKTVSLNAGDTLEIEGIVPERIEVTAKSDVLTRLNGSARAIVLVAGAVRRDLRPSLLEFLAANNSVAMWWSAVLLIWGFLWSANRLLDS